MNVIRGFCTNPQQPLTSPLPESSGVYFALHGGDVCEPMALGSNWFSPPFPSRVWRWRCPWPVLPFFSWRLGSLAGYAGFKPYGVDSPVYGEWLCDPAEVFPGSLALCVTIRNGLTVLVPAVLAGLAAWAFW